MTVPTAGVQIYNSACVVPQKHAIIDTPTCLRTFPFIKYLTLKQYERSSARRRPVCLRSSATTPERVQSLFEAVDLVFTWFEIMRA